MASIKLIEEELVSWYNFHNVVLGVLAFSFALGCVSISNGIIAVIASTLSIFMIAAIGENCSPHFSKLLHELRRKEFKTPQELEVLKFVEGNLFSKRRFLAFDIGFYTLLAAWVFNISPFVMKLYPHA